MKKGTREDNIFMVKCINVLPSDSDNFTLGKWYRAMMATPEEYMKRGIYIWVEGNRTTAYGISEDTFNHRFVNIENDRNKKLELLGI